MVPKELENVCSKILGSAVILLNIPKSMFYGATMSSLFFSRPELGPLECRIACHDTFPSR
jgi:hypothetical protein